MKLLVIILYITALQVFTSNLSFSSRLLSQMTFKSQTKSLFNQLYTIANGDSVVTPQAASTSTSFKYLSYDEMISTLNELTKKHPKYLKLSTAQEIYGLPNPGGKCGAKK
jgi:hypothetical protein